MCNFPKDSDDAVDDDQSHRLRPGELADEAEGQEGQQVHRHDAVQKGHKQSVWIELEDLGVKMESLGYQYDSVRSKGNIT